MKDLTIKDHAGDAILVYDLSGNLTMECLEGDNYRMDYLFKKEQKGEIKKLIAALEEWLQEAGEE